MKRLFVSVLVILLCTSSVIYSQNGVTIGSNSAPANSAVLDLRSTTKGLLPPRMTAIQRHAISSPTPGLIVFDTDLSQLFLFDGTSWQPLVGGSSGNSVSPSQTELQLEEQEDYGRFGIDVDIFGNYAVIGATGNRSGSVVSAGAVYVYKKGTTGLWTQVAKLSASDPQTNSNFGASVSIHGNYISVGAPNFDVAGIFNAGKVYVFLKGSGDTWTQQTSLTKPGGSAAQYLFGYNVDISTTTTTGAAIIATGKGAAYAYRYNGASWTFLQILNPVDGANSDATGWEVTIDGDYCAISATSEINLISLAPTGAVYVYVFGGGVWSQQQRLPGLRGNARFGYSLSLQGSRIAIGAPFAPHSSGATSAVFIYERNAAIWRNTQTLYLTERQGFDEYSYYGSSVCLDGDRLLVSLPTAIIDHNGSFFYGSNNAFVILYTYRGTGYVPKKIINDNEPFPPNQNVNFFGNSVSSSNGNHVIGIPGKQSGVSFHSGTVAFGYFE